MRPELLAKETTDGKTLILARSIFGIRTRTFNISYGEFIRRWNEYADDEDGHIQDAFPDLSPMEREFFITGMGDEDWEKTFGKRTTNEQNVGNNAKVGSHNPGDGQ